MTFMPAPKSLLSRLLLSVILGCALPPPVLAEAEVAGDTQYRFGEWLVVLPVASDLLLSSPQSLAVPVGGFEPRLYWQDGKRRAARLHFDALDAQQDFTVLRSGTARNRLKGCSPRGGGRIAPIGPLHEDIPEWPDGFEVMLTGSERGLRRSGDTLAADLGTHRVQITLDSPLVRVGEWDSADFCRYELDGRSPNAASDDEDD